MKRARNSDVSCGASISVLRAKKNSEKLNCFEILFRFIVVAAAVDVPSCCIDMCVCGTLDVFCVVYSYCHHYYVKSPIQLHVHKRRATLCQLEEKKRKTVTATGTTSNYVSFDCFKRFLRALV